MKKYLIIAVLAAIGVFNAAYLSYHAYGFWFGANADALRFLPCDISSVFSCSDILKNPRALIFGLPFPMIALIVYPILLIISLIGWFSKKTCPAKVLTGLALGGMCFNSYVIYQEFIVGIFCPLCAMCTAIIVIIFFISISIWKGENKNTTPAAL
ncbi:vitamin K epoxide reductase family protein [Candidatus Gracilibacteria bacterium]|nr:vitamin K epoxide reductase family protein [Candidatus Gracilibacteria bacterium]